MSRFYACLKDLTKQDPKSLQYNATWDFEFGKIIWNDGRSPCMRNYFLPRVTSGIAVTAETTYAGTEENPFTPERTIRLGHHFYRALRNNILLP